MDSQLCGLTLCGSIGALSVAEKHPSATHTSVTLSLENGNNLLKLTVPEEGTSHHAICSLDVYRPGVFPEPFHVQHQHQTYALFLEEGRGLFTPPPSRTQFFSQKGALF